MTHLDFSVDVRLLDLNYRWMCPEYNQNDTFRLVVCTPITNVIIGMPAQCAVSYRKKLFASATLHFSPKDLLHKLDFFVGFFFGKVLITYIAFWQFRRCQIHCWMYRHKIRWYPYPFLFCQLRCRCRCEGGQKQVWRKEKSRQKSTFVKKNPWFSNF